jgi:catechol 2,3-dioxygenase-like lactoylglutathione lyase family enzyme
MNGKLNHVEIYVSDLNKSKDFWNWLLTEKFAYSIHQNWECGVSFKLEDTYLVFVQTEPAYLETNYHRKNTGLNHIAFHCISQQFVDELTLEIEAKNIPLLYKEKHPRAGGLDSYAVFFEDPDRIKIEVAVYP